MNSTYYCGPKADSRVSSPQERRSYDIEKATVRKKKERNPRGVWKGEERDGEEGKQSHDCQEFPLNFPHLSPHTPA